MPYPSSAAGRSAEQVGDLDVSVVGYSLALLLAVVEALLGALSVGAAGAVLEPSLLLLESSPPLTVALPLFRLSVIYQPEPLNTMPTGWKTRRTAPEQDGQVCSASSLKDWNCSNCAPHESHL